MINETPGHFISKYSFSVVCDIVHTNIFQFKSAFVLICLGDFLKCAFVLSKVNKSENAIVDEKKPD